MYTSTRSNRYNARPSLHGLGAEESLVSSASNLTSKEPKKVRGMFASLAPTYDRLNHLLSFNRDKAWRRRAGKWVNLLPGEHALDVCAGTLDLSVELCQKGGRVTALDFCHPMLVVGKQKIAARSDHAATVAVSEGDALKLPFEAGSFDALTVAFGVRNLVDMDVGLNEFARVLKPGGRLAILEFSTPQNRMYAFFYRQYNRFLLPLIGRLISRHRDAYEYLPATVAAFPGQDAFAERIADAGFSKVSYTNLTFGTVALHIGIRA